MQDETIKIISGPDKPALQWAVAYPEREQVHFRLERDGVDAQVLKMDELRQGFSFALQGVIKSGQCQGRPFQAIYSIETRSGSLSVPE